LSENRSTNSKKWQRHFFEASAMGVDVRCHVCYNKPAYDMVRCFMIDEKQLARPKEEYPCIVTTTGTASIM
jgi:hypothetical protein